MWYTFIHAPSNTHTHKIKYQGDSGLASDEDHKRNVLQDVFLLVDDQYPSPPRGSTLSSLSITLRTYFLLV